MISATAPIQRPLTNAVAIGLSALQRHRTQWQRNSALTADVNSVNIVSMNDTREQLVLAARDMLLEGGLPALSMRKLGARCGISAAAIYRHFPDKDALLATVVGEAFGIFMTYLAAALAETDPLKRYRAMNRQYFKFASDQPRYYQLMFMADSQALGFDRVDEATKRRAEGTFQMLVDRIAECQREGVFQAGNPIAQATFAWSSLHGLAALSLVGKLGPGAIEAGSPLIEAQIAGIEIALAQGDFWAQASTPEHDC